MVRALTDNRNRSVADIRRTFSRHGGNLGENGCVAWMFEQKGYINIPLNGHNPDSLFELAVEAGADDVVIGEDTIEVFVGRLRKKMGVDVIKTVRGLGYCIEDPEKVDGDAAART